MRLLIIGAVAAGTSAAAKARRNNEENQIVIYEKGEYISYAGCGMAYYIAGDVASGNSIHPRNVKYFKDTYNVDIKLGHEVVKIIPENQTIIVKDLASGIEFVDRYDKLIIATGARALIPPVPGVNKEHVFPLRNVNDMYKITSFLEEKKPVNAVVVGGGFIGLEMTESLVKLGLNVSIVEMKDQIATNLDVDMAKLVELELLKENVNVYKGLAAAEIHDHSVTLNNGETILGDIVIMSAGVRPNSEIAVEAGIKTGKFRGILVNDKLETNIPNIYAAGDVSEQYHLLLKDYSYLPMGSTANKQGRVAGDQATGGNLIFKGVFGTSVYRVFNQTVAQTGLNEASALAAGYEPVTILNIKPNKVTYLGGKDMTIKAVADKKSGKILGAQIVGPEGVDRRIDVLATAIYFGATASDLVDLDLAYSPPYSTVRDPVNYTGMIISNILNKDTPQVSSKEVLEKIKKAEPLTIIDTRPAILYGADHIEGAISIPLTDLRKKAPTLPTDRPICLYCSRGLDGYVGQKILLNLGFSNVYNVRGGYLGYLIENDF